MEINEFTLSNIGEITVPFVIQTFIYIEFSLLALICYFNHFS